MKFWHVKYDFSRRMQNRMWRTHEYATDAIRCISVKPFHDSHHVDLVMIRPQVSIMEASLCLQILCGTMLGFRSFSQHLLLLTPSIVRSCRRWNHTTILIMCRRHRSSVGTPCTDPANSKSISFTARGDHSAGILRQHDILGVWPIPALKSSLHPVRNVIIEK
jgi:hypothetical protein